MSELALLALVLLLAVLVPLVIWVRRRRKAYGPVLKAGGEAALLGEMLEEQRKINERLDDLANRLEENARKQEGDQK